MNLNDLVLQPATKWFVLFSETMLTMQPYPSCVCLLCGHFSGLIRLKADQTNGWPWSSLFLYQGFILVIPEQPFYPCLSLGERGISSRGDG